jgi:hypothetical protein
MLPGYYTKRVRDICCIVILLQTYFKYRIHDLRGQNKITRVIIEQMKKRTHNATILASLLRYQFLISIRRL